jgi:hypothetical protein
VNRLRPYIQELINGSFVLFGLAIAWMLTPDGASRDTIGGTLLALSIAWLVTMPIRLGGGKD